MGELRNNTRHRYSVCVTVASQGETRDLARVRECLPDQEDLIWRLIFQDAESEGCLSPGLRAWVDGQPTSAGSKVRVTFAWFRDDNPCTDNMIRPTSSMTNIITQIVHVPVA